MLVCPAICTASEFVNSPTHTINIYKYMVNLLLPALVSPGLSYHFCFRLITRLFQLIQYERQLKFRKTSYINIFYMIISRFALRVQLKEVIKKGKKNIIPLSINPNINVPAEKQLVLGLVGAAKKGSNSQSGSLFSVFPGAFETILKDLTSRRGPLYKKWEENYLLVKQNFTRTKSAYAKKKKILKKKNVIKKDALFYL